MKLNEIILLWQTKTGKTNLFDGMNLPDAKYYSQEFLYNLIMLEYGDMNVLFNRTEVFELSVRMFWERHTPVINKLVETENYDYDPLDDHSYKMERIGEGTGKENLEGTEGTNTDITQTTISGTTTNNYVNAFNQQSGDSPQSRQNVNQDSGQTGNQKQNTTINRDKGDSWESKFNITKSGLNSHTYQELIEEQRRLVDFHVEDYILTHWAQELMIALW